LQGKKRRSAPRKGEKKTALRMGGRYRRPFLRKEPSSRRERQCPIDERKKTDYDQPVEGWRIRMSKGKKQASIVLEREPFSCLFGEMDVKGAPNFRSRTKRGRVLGVFGGEGRLCPSSIIYMTFRDLMC